VNKKELVKYLDYTQRTIYKLMRKEGLPSTRIRGQFRFKKDIVDRWLEERMSQSGGESQNNKGEPT